MTDMTDKMDNTNGKAVVGFEPDYEAMDRAMQTLDRCPHCQSQDLDMFPADCGYTVACTDCEMASPILDSPEEAADWWRRLGAALTMEAGAAMLAADEEAQAFGGDVAETLTISMSRDQAQALWSLATQMMEGLSCHQVAGETHWTARVGETRVTVRDQELDQAARAMCAIREVLNAAHRAAGDSLGTLLALADSVPQARRCRVCGCTDQDCSQCIERTGQPCHWVYDDLCSACADRVIVCGLCNEEFTDEEAKTCERCGATLCPECVCDCGDGDQDGEG